ncbi:MAG: aldehyde dehydrogenase family protein [Candidatus Verstraetearchaeota archaeon]|nr:aldehyde dehydrogenase family protein [Candidatus Verstraetearchaeota archaeon]
MSFSPLASERCETSKRNYGGIIVEEITENCLTRLLSRADEIQNRLSSVPVEERLGVIGKIGEAWGERYAGGKLKWLRDALSDSTGYSPKMIDLELSLVPSVLNAQGIKRNLEGSFPLGINCLERFKSIGDGEYCWHRPAGPVFIISSGNSLIPPLIPTVLALATGNMTILRPSIANFIGVKTVWSILEEVEGDVAEIMRDALILSYLTHDSPSLEYLLSRSEIGVVNFWGGEPARTEISKRVASNPHHPALIINGPLTGYAIVDSRCADDRAVSALAKNIVLYDQQLCSSPTEAVFVGDWERAKEFATKVGMELEELSQQLPLKLTESYSYLTEGVRRALQFRGSMVFRSGSSASWTLVLSKSESALDESLKAFPEFGLHSRRRFLEMIVLDDYRYVVDFIRRLPGRKSFTGIDGVQSVGICVPEAERDLLAKRLAEAGVFRILPLEDMYMRSALEPYDGMNLAQVFTYAVYRRDKPLSA